MGESRKALRASSPARASRVVPLRRTAVTPGATSGVLDGDLPVALDEDDEDVLAAQAVEQGRRRRARRSGSAARVASSKRCWSCTVARTSRPWATASPAVLVEATGPAGASCSDSAAHTAHTTPRTATPRAERRRCRAVHAAEPDRRPDDDGDEQRDARARPGRATTTVAVAPIESRSTPIAGPKEPQSNTGLNGRPSCAVKPASRSLTTASRPSTTPAAAATIRLGRGGSTSPIATRASPSSGMRANAAGVSWSSRGGATRTAQTTAAATSAVASAQRPAGARTGAGAVQPDDAAAERLGQQHQRDADRDHADRAGQHARRPRR